MEEEPRIVIIIEKAESAKKPIDRPMSEAEIETVFPGTLQATKEEKKRVMDYLTYKHEKDDE